VPSGELSEWWLGSRRRSEAGTGTAGYCRAQLFHLRAQSHGLFARCLRFAAFLPGCPVVRPRKTRFRLVVNLCRTGYTPAWVPGEVSARLHRFLLTQALPGALKALVPALTGPRSSSASTTSTRSRAPVADACDSSKSSPKPAVLANSSSSSAWTPPSRPWQGPARPPSTPTPPRSTTGKPRRLGASPFGIAHLIKSLQMLR